VAVFFLLYMYTGEAVGRNFHSLRYSSFRVDNDDNRQIIGVSLVKVINTVTNN
jgi:hypothetical protein